MYINRIIIEIIFFDIFKISFMLFLWVCEFFLKEKNKQKIKELEFFNEEYMKIYDY